jgi:hypothetical protein
MKKLIRLFVSYSSKDQVFVERLANDLKKRDFQTWLDTNDIVPGTNWGDSIQSGLDLTDIMLLIISPEAIASNNVKLEWQYFFDKDKPIIPIRFKPANVPFQLSRSHYIDFFDSPYDKAFEKLITVVETHKLTVWKNLVTAFFDPKSSFKMIGSLGYRISWYFPTVSETQKEYFYERMEHSSDRELSNIVSAIHIALEDGRDDVAELIGDLFNYLPNPVERLRYLGRACLIHIEHLEGLFQSIEGFTQEYENSFRNEVEELYKKNIT